MVHDLWFFFFTSLPRLNRTQSFTERAPDGALAYASTLPRRALTVVVVLVTDRLSLLLSPTASKQEGIEGGRLFKMVATSFNKRQAAFDGLRSLCLQLQAEVSLYLSIIRRVWLQRWMVSDLSFWKGMYSRAVNTAKNSWRLALTGRFRLLDQWCAFVQLDLAMQNFNLKFTELWFHDVEIARYETFVKQQMHLFSKIELVGIDLASIPIRNLVGETLGDDVDEDSD